MNTEEFIAEYKKANDIRRFLQSHIKETYVDFEEKLRVCIAIVKDSNYKIVRDKLIYWKNMPKQLYQFQLWIIRLYTDIELNENKLIHDYNLLAKENLINQIASIIPQHEYIELQTLLDMTSDDEEYNTRSLPSFLETKFESFEMLLSSLENVIGNTKDGE